MRKKKKKVLPLNGKVLMTMKYRRTPRYQVSTLGLSYFLHWKIWRTQNEKVLHTSHQLLPCHEHGAQAKAELDVASGTQEDITGL
jgi:hypothetical protein